MREPTRRANATILQPEFFTRGLSRATSSPTRLTKSVEQVKLSEQAKGLRPHTRPDEETATEETLGIREVLFKKFSSLPDAGLVVPTAEIESGQKQTN